MRHAVKPVFGHEKNCLLLVLEVASHESSWARANRHRTLFTRVVCSPAGVYQVVAGFGMMVDL